MADSSASLAAAQPSLAVAAAPLLDIPASPPPLPPVAPVSATAEAPPAPFLLRLAHELSPYVLAAKPGGAGAADALGAAASESAAASPAVASAGALSSPESASSSSSSSSCSSSAALLRAGNCGTRVLSFLTILELFNIQRVSTWLRDLARDALITQTHVDLSQFWFCLGQEQHRAQTEHVCALLARSTRVASLSLAFCHHLRDRELCALLDAVPNKAAVKRISYGFRLTWHILFVELFESGCWSISESLDCICRLIDLA
jgi:hypothetical protein